MELGDARESFARLLHVSLTLTDSKNESYGIEALANLPDREARFSANHLKTENNTRPRKSLDLTPALGLNVSVDTDPSEHHCCSTLFILSNPAAS